MPIVLFRVDERLIHGQVVIGWGQYLRPSRFVVVDDELAGSDWEQDLYRLSMAEGQRADFLSVEQARREMDELRAAEVRAVVLTRDVATMLRLAEDGRLSGERVNLGGIHHAAGRRQVLPYLHLDRADRARIRQLGEQGVEVSARDLPSTGRVDAAELVEDA